MSPSSDQIGVDESGKGDYFGPLVIGGVYVTSEDEAQLRAAGVRDSKALSDKKVSAIAAHIRASCPSTLVVIGPERYNSLYRSLRNLNRLLAWGHARAIENLLAKVSCHQVVSDQFGDERFLESALMKRGRTVRLVQKPRAEDEIAVAAASIIARAEFLRRLQELSSRYDVLLPKGASNGAIAAGKEFVRRYGADTLGQVAKLHFRTTASILS
jgi:ribonuclease HIII